MAKQKCEVIGREKMFSQPVLATIKIDKNPTFFTETSFIDNSGKKITIPKRLVCIRNVPGGYIKLFVYGANPDDAGKTLTAKITFEKKLIKNQETGSLSTICYGNVKIMKGAKAILSLAIRDTMKPMESWAPIIKMTFNGKPPTFIGFAKRE
ncbi:MAG: hypothetical protein ABII25_09925 [bacterium]